MTAAASAKPAPAVTGNRLQEVDRLGGAIIQANTAEAASSQEIADAIAAACPRRGQRELHVNPRRRRSEDQLQRTVCQHLRHRGAPGLVWWHTPNGGTRRPVEAAILKGLGTRAGVADLIFVHRGRPVALELKTDDGQPTVEQMEFVSDFNSAGGSAAIVNGLDRALRTLETWGLLRGTTQGVQR